MNIKNCPTEKLEKAISHSLPDLEQLEIESHLDGCLACREKLEQLVADEPFWQRAGRLLLDSVSLDTALIADAPTIDIRISNATPGLVATSAFSNSTPSTPALDEPSHPEMLGRIDGFDIEQLIGQGGMGIVYKGFDTELNRPIAIKVLAPHLAANGVARQRFAREARAAAAVVHPNVVPIHSVSSSTERPYIVMTLVDGRSLQAEVEHNGPMPIKDVVRIGQQIAAGLSAAHAQGLVHRDIKPANILLEKDISRVMITDFGLARAADDAAITQTGWLAGTPHYMSPEQAKGGDVDHRSDLFSLGSVLYFLATGREPFRAEIPFAILQKIGSDDPTSPRALNSDIPKTLDRIILRLLEKRAEHRFTSAEEVQSVMTQYLAHLQHPQSQAKPKIRTRQNRRARTLLAASAFVMAAIVCGIWLAMQNWSEGSSSAESTNWKEGLEPLHLFQNEMELFEYDLQQLEQSYEPNTHNTGVNILDLEAQEFLQPLREIEANLFDRNLPNNIKDQ